MTDAVLHQSSVRRPLPAATLAVLGLGGSWVAFALAETVLGDLDSLTSASALSDQRGRVVAAGLLHLVAGFLLVLGLAGVAGRAWRTMTGRLGLVASSLLPVAVGSFGMLHLLAAEPGGEHLEELQTFGPWAVPVLVVAKLGMPVLTLLLAGLARAGDVPWWTVAVAGAGAVLHLVRGEGLPEVASHWLLAAGLVAAALTLARRAGATQPAPADQAASGAGAG